MKKIINLVKADAILLESNGKFGIIDSGEDTDYPDGSDPKYPLRSGISKEIGNEEIMEAADKWIWSDDKCFYLSETGQMLVNQWVLSGEKYYYLAEDGHMLTDTWIGKWYVDKTGAWVE